MHIMTTLHIGDVIEKFPNCKIYCSEYTRVALSDYKLNLSFYHGTPVIFMGEQINIVKENDNIPLLIRKNGNPRNTRS